MRYKMIFAVDKNLGLVIDDPRWQQFFKKYDIQISPYTDINKMIEDLNKNTTSLAYLPTAAYYFMRTNDFYSPIANALFTANQTTKIGSLLIVNKKSGVDELSQLKNKRYGCINKFCTSSYFAPAFLLWDNHYSIYNFFSEIKEVGAWQLQIDAVINGEIDATMVQEDVWYKLPGNAAQTKIIAKIDKLPSALLICSNAISEVMKYEFKDLLFSYKTNPNTLFDGFVPFKATEVRQFFEKAELAFTPVSGAAS